MMRLEADSEMIRNIAYKHDSSTNMTDKPKHRENTHDSTLNGQYRGIQTITEMMGKLIADFFGCRNVFLVDIGL